MAPKVSDQAIFQEECRRDPEFRNRVLGLERMLRVKVQKETMLVLEGAVPGQLVASHAEKTLLRSAMENLDDGEVPQPVRSSELAVVAASAEASGVSSELAVGAATAEASGVASELVVGAATAEASDRAATTGESQRIIGLRER